MDPHYAELAGTSHDLGTWAAHASGMSGGDEISMCLKAMATLHNMYMADYVHQSAAFLVGDQDVFLDDQTTAPAILGGSAGRANKASPSAGESNVFEDDQIVPPSVIE
ncbi:hypothetical protein [Actinocrispum wychmicini]|uniref:hypothetical protein n=1 Tax=Actinocrispum wychmicini TaxID=1213861 RepID=UPI00104D8BCF|nr:hypothetical protein [Actinocrispum wychmicini]